MEDTEPVEVEQTGGKTDSVDDDMGHPADATQVGGDVLGELGNIDGIEPMEVMTGGSYSFGKPVSPGMHGEVVQNGGKKRKYTKKAKKAKKAKKVKKTRHMKKKTRTMKKKLAKKTKKNKTRNKK
jgi:hypothetical protein